MEAITKVKNGTIVLPKIIQRSWQGASVFIKPSNDGILIKKVSKPSLLQLKPKLQKTGKLIKQKDIDEAVKKARKKIYKGRS